MSAIHLDNRLVHYEVFGRGQPIIFLHSWLGSWRYWVPTMDLVSERYRAYALDFWGFGESERKDVRFTIPGYVDMLYAFMDCMGIQRANLVGHGMGGMVAVRAAKEHPERFLRLMVISTPMEGVILHEWIKPGALSRLMGRNNPTNIWARLVRNIPIDDPEVQQELFEDTDNLSEQVVQDVHQSILTMDLRTDLDELDSMPLLAVYGKKDVIVPAEHASSFLHHDTDRPHQLIELPQSNHFPFLEQTSNFNRLLMDFMVSKGTPVEIKEEWRRRVTQREYL
mgnify:CR=1 FL=1